MKKLAEKAKGEGILHQTFTTDAPGKSEGTMQEKKELLEPSTRKKPGGTGAGDAALIAHLQLGPVEEVYTLARVQRILIIFLILVAILLFSIGMWGFTSQYGFPASLVWSLGLVLLPFLFIFLMRYRFGGMRLYICTDGLLYLWRKKRESIRWDEVGGVRQHTTTGSRSMYTSIWITSKGGREFSFDPPDRSTQLLTALQVKGTQYGFRVTSNTRLPSLPKTGPSGIIAIGWLKPVYSGREGSISGPVTLSIVYQGQDGNLRATWSRDDFGTAFSCEGTITREGILALRSTDADRDSVVQIHGSMLPNGQLEGSLDVRGKDGSSHRHDWSLA